MERGGGRRRRGKRGRGKFDGHRSDYHHRDYDRRTEETQPPMPTRPIILAKPDRPPSANSPSMDMSRTPPSDPSTSSQPSGEPPMYTLKTRATEHDTGAAASSSLAKGSSQQSTSSSAAAGNANVPSMLAGDAIPKPAQVHVAQRPAVPETRQSASAIKLTPPSKMTHAVKIVDDNLQWCDPGIDVLLEQTDFFVIGVIGQQGCGKSTVMSLLAATEQNRKDYKFKAQSYEVLENCGHMTEGIDMYVTQERMILLDTQPMLSAAVLDRLIRMEKKYPTDYVSAENCVEMQSLQIATFLLTVCNVVIVCMDWFVDLTLLKFVQTAEMLKPPTPSSQESQGDAHEEHYPHTVFLLNKAERADYTPRNYTTMQNYLKSALDKSSLKITELETTKLIFGGDSSVRGDGGGRGCEVRADSTYTIPEHKACKNCWHSKGTANMAYGNIIPGLSKDSKTDVNLYLLPQIEPRKKQDSLFGALPPSFKGHAGFDELMTKLRYKLFSLPRNPLTHTTLTEKNWFHYAARTWEAVKKSPLLSEYNRLLN